MRLRSGCWSAFAGRPTLIGEWVAVWWIPRHYWGSSVTCDSCDADLSRARWICVACYPPREALIREGFSAIAPATGQRHCRACARRFLSIRRRVLDPVPLILTSHHEGDLPLVPVLNFRDDPAFDFGYPLKPGWRHRLPPH